MMTEGVHNGNHGPLFHPISELGKVPQSWNGKPIVINHPYKDGESISANDPEILEESGIGLIFDTHVEGMKLKAKAWLEELKLSDVSPEVLESIKSGKELEVSVERRKI